MCTLWHGQSWDGRQIQQERRRSRWRGLHQHNGGRIRSGHGVGQLRLLVDEVGPEQGGGNPAAHQGACQPVRFAESSHRRRPRPRHHRGRRHDRHHGHRHGRHPHAHLRHLRRRNRHHGRHHLAH